jgi:transposase-like protein
MISELTLEQRQDRFRKMYELYLEGKSLRAISMIMGISHERVRQILTTRSNSFEYRKIKEAIDTRKSKTWQTAEIINLLNVGNSCTSVAEILNISVSAVKRISARYNKDKQKLQENIKVDSKKS